MIGMFGRDWHCMSRLNVLAALSADLVLWSLPGSFVPLGSHDPNIFHFAACAEPSNRLAEGDGYSIVASPQQAWGEKTSSGADIVNRSNSIHASSDRYASFLQGSEAAELVTDPELLRLAVSQLVDNACKYSDPISAVVLGIERQPHAVVVRASNRGRSIPPHEKDHILERFQRGDECSSRCPDMLHAKLPLPMAAA